MAQKCSFLRQFYFRLSNRPYHYIFTPPLTAHARRAITSIDFYTQGRGEAVQPVCRLKLMDKARCLELLGKYKAMWTDKHDFKQTGDVTFQMVYHPPVEA